jgi:hypothetical protein
MANPSSTTQPALSTVSVQYNDLLGPNTWLTFQLGGVTCPGTIPVGGVKGFRRETGWDIKKGKGVSGATLTLVTRPPIEGTITMQLVTPGDFDDWDAFVAAVLSTSERDQQQNGLSIWYPQFASIGLTSVVIKNYTGPEYKGRGMYHTSVELIEWFQPPPVSNVATVATQAPDQSNEDNLPPQEDPELTAAKLNFAAAYQASRP